MGRLRYKACLDVISVNIYLVEYIPPSPLTHFDHRTRLKHRGPIINRPSLIRGGQTHLLAFLSTPLGLASIGVDDGDTGNFVGHGVWWAPPSSAMMIKVPKFGTRNRRAVIGHVWLPLGYSRSPMRHRDALWFNFCGHSDASQSFRKLEEDAEPIKGKP